MRLAFYLITASMIVAALLLVLWPLVRHGRQQGRPRGVFALAMLVAFCLPVAAIGLYLAVGTPVALDGVPKADAGMSIDQAVAELKTHLTQKPDDLQGWMLLGQTYSVMHKAADARDAYDHALKLDQDNSVAMVGWAEADSLLREDHRIEGRAQELLERAVKIDPQSQRGLWLLGISQFQHDQYAEAAATWRTLQPQLDPGSNVAKAVQEQIAVAEARANGGKTAPETPTAEAAQPSLQVQVALSPSLKDKLAPGDTLFVYARAEQGPPMPLAVAKLDASALPATVTLNDGMGMTPQLKLSSASRVFVGARISKSGQAIAQPGDLEGDAGVVDVNTHTPIRISIDKVH
ncbi:cytochrome c-type biogenesis protein CcmH [Dyella jiangningensis]|uniref:tetratricopeptide repeat protein n=1 Tax=Dyella sp. AtDHG13 TaxID=1938897 RepID=UPI000880D38D|nr:tetratricopeptide repeat protein [Dyella sp. AtDHG13]PXV60855.1 cytochrome c-type biogenesis protein CcmH [Dyella sp. AtDHG13]SDK95679.1 cytochrome c-type biogenesis protein CcmH [Dyella jiangningensis]